MMLWLYDEKDGLCSDKCSCDALFLFGCGRITRALQATQHSRHYYFLFRTYCSGKYILQETFEERVTS